jgi:predicted ATP-binding protein involved in virulence
MKIDKNRQSVLITKGNTSIDFSTLSDGEKGVITLFGDIARRLAIANETLENPLEGNGIILIDEIDLHLHPSWQRKICHALVKTFPNCQFVITTHSPQILGELKTNEIWLLNDFNVYRPDSSFGLTSNQILDEVMDVIDGDFSLSRDSTIAKKLQALNLAMETEKFAEAKKIIAEIEETTGTNLHEAESCKIALEMMESEE